MSATYTWDIFSTLDGYGSYGAGGDWGGYWGKQGPELLDHRRTLYDTELRMVFGANTFRQFLQFRAAEPVEFDPWVLHMMEMPTTVVSSTLDGAFDWDDVAVVSGDAVDVVTRLKAESEVPLRSHGSLTLNRTLMAAGLVDQVQLTIFPAISGRTGEEPVFAGAADFDLELLEHRTLDGRTQELTYRPTLH